MKLLGRTNRQILTVLASGPAHGYGLMQQIESIFGTDAVPSVGGVYGALDKLEGRGLIRHDHDAIENGRARRYFAITDEGRRRLEIEIQELAGDVAAASSALRLNTGGGPNLAGGMA